MVDEGVKHVKISQLVNKMCSQQAWSQSRNQSLRSFGYEIGLEQACQQVKTMLLFCQVATSLSLTTY